MKPLIKYPLAALFALLMGYSQVFAYLGPGPLRGNKDSHGAIQLPTASPYAFTNSVFSELEDEDDRASFTDSLAAPRLLSHDIIGLFSDPSPHSAQLPIPDFARGSWLRFRVFRL